MFGPAFFGKAYWGGAYWGPAGGGIVPPEPPVPEQTTPGGWYRYHHRQQTKDEIRRERERLGIIPRQARKIEQLADELAEEITAEEPNAIIAEITAAQEFGKLLDALARRDAERRAAIAEFAANLILIRILQEREEEERAIVTLLMEM